MGFSFGGFGGFNPKQIRINFKKKSKQNYFHKNN
jgi:hypothetical protein